MKIGSQKAEIKCMSTCDSCLCVQIPFPSVSSVVKGDPPPRVLLRAELCEVYGVLCPVPQTAVGMPWGMARNMLVFFSRLVPPYHHTLRVVSYYLICHALIRGV